MLAMVDVGTEQTPHTTHSGNCPHDASDRDALDLVQRYLIFPAVVELRCFRRFVTCDELRFFDRPTIGEVVRDPRAAKGMTADFRGQPDRGGSSRTWSAIG